MKSSHLIPRPILVLVVLAGHGAAMRAAEGPRFVFTLDGHAFEPMIYPVEGTQADPRPGDVIRIDEALLVLGEERECRFVREEENEAKWKTARWKLFLETGGRRILVWASTGSARKDDVWVRTDPFAKLNDEEARSLRGINLDKPTAEDQAILRRIDPTRCLVSLRIEADKAVGLPPLPAALRYLWADLKSGYGDAKRDFTRLRNCPALRFLAIDDERVSLRVLDHCTQLRHLVLGWLDVTDVSVLSGLGDLRFLDLSGCKSLDDISFAKSLGKLEDLRLVYTSVHDLSPLTALRALVRINLDRAPVGDLAPLVDLPRLESISANGTELGELPKGGFAALKSLEIMSTRMAPEVSEAFAKSHPNCRVRHVWEKTLKVALAGVDQVRIRSGGTCHRTIEEEKTLCELKDAAGVREFLDMIRIDESESGGYCMCCGDPSFEFYKAGKLVATVGFHHGKSLRWGGWIGDAELRPESATALVDWLAAHGATGPLEERRQKETRARKDEEFISFFPLRARDLLKGARPSEAVPDGWDEKAAAVWEQVANEVNDPVAAAVAACRALGSIEEPWTGVDFQQQVVLSSAKTMQGEAFLAAIDRLTDDRRALLGAARLAFAQRVLEKVPDHARTETGIRLAEIALIDGPVEDKDHVIRILSRDKDARVALFLRNVAGGKVGREPVKGSKEEARFEDVGIRACAWLALAERGETSSAEVEKLLAGAAFERTQDRAALEVCLALLGDAKRIKAEHFKIGSDTINFAALKAIERFGGREGMDVLIDAALDSYADEEAVLVVERLTGQKWYRNGKSERPSWHVKEIRAWWKENRETFLRQHPSNR